MNVNDTQIAYSIMNKAGYLKTEILEEADVIFLNTCAIREHAEQKIWSRLGQIRTMGLSNHKSVRPVVGVLGCMAERLKENIFREKLVDVVAGPDSYRDLPNLVTRASTGERVIQVMLSQDETYADISPVRTDDNGVSAYVSIGRGCNQHCTYCIVPRTRGIERSRPAASIEQEILALSQQGFKEVTLLGQNVNSYNDKSEFEDTQALPKIEMAKGFSTIYKTPTAGVTFSQLISRISKIDPEMRIRFTSPHPKDFPDQLLYLIRDLPNVCKSIHIPAQSGNSQVLQTMRRGYTRESYIELIHHIRDICGPETGLSSDFISGFCSETEEQHQDTLSLMELVKYDQAFMFAYSMREKTPAHRKYVDDVPEETKKRRLAEVINTFHKNLSFRNEPQIGKIQLVLVEGNSKKDSGDLYGRNDFNKKVVFPHHHTPTLSQAISGHIPNSSLSGNVKPGDYVVVRITNTTGMTLIGNVVAKTTLCEFEKNKSLLGI